MRSRDRVAIGWMDPGQMDGALALNLAVLYRERGVDLLRVECYGLLSRGRNEMVRQFLDTTDAAWLLILDSDMKFKDRRELADFDRLCSVAHDTERPIIAGLYFGAWPGDPYPAACPLIFRCQTGTNSRFVPIVDYPVDKVIPIDSAGTGCLMIHRSVLERMRAEANPHQGPNWCWFADMPINQDWFSEDHWFCSRAREMGFPLHAHTGVVMQHRKRFWLDDRHFYRSEATSDALPELQQRPDRREPLPDLRPRSEHDERPERDDRGHGNIGDDLAQAAGA